MLNTRINYPVNTGSNIVTATELEVLNDQALLFGTGPNNADISLTALAAPGGIAVGQLGTAGATSYTYVVADTSALGSAPSAGTTTATGNATLTPANANVITWTGIVGHTYNVYRSASAGTPSGLGFIGTVTVTAVAALGSTAPNTQLASLTDTGIVATLNVPTVNTTGALGLAGPLFCASVLLSLGTPQTVTNTGAATFTVANMATAMLIRAGATGSAVSDVTPTAAALVAAFPGVKAGQSFKFWFKNTTGFNVSLTGGAGVTVVGTAVVPTVNTRDVLVVFNNVTPGTESVSVYTGQTAAY